MMKSGAIETKKHPSDGPELILCNAYSVKMENKKNAGSNSNLLCISKDREQVFRSVIRPNLMNADRNYVIYDKTGELSYQFAPLFERNGYKVYHSQSSSFCSRYSYDPFRHLDKGNLNRFCKSVIENMRESEYVRNIVNEHQLSKADFKSLLRASSNLLHALLLYILDYCPASDRCYRSFSLILDAADEDPKHKGMAFFSVLNMIMLELRSTLKEDAENEVLEHYDYFMAFNNTLRRLARESLKTIFSDLIIESSDGEIDFSTLTEKNTAVFFQDNREDKKLLSALFFMQCADALFRHDTQPDYIPQSSTQFIFPDVSDIGAMPFLCYQIGLSHDLNTGVSYLLSDNSLSQIQDYIGINDFHALGDGLLLAGKNNSLEGLFDYALFMEPVNDEDQLLKEYIELRINDSEKNFKILPKEFFKTYVHKPFAEKEKEEQDVKETALFYYKDEFFGTVTLFNNWYHESEYARTAEYNPRRYNSYRREISDYDNSFLQDEAVEIEPNPAADDINLTDGLNIETSEVVICEADK